MLDFTEFRDVNIPRLVLRSLFGESIMSIALFCVFRRQLFLVISLSRVLWWLLAKPYMGCGELFRVAFDSSQEGTPHRQYL